MNIARLASLSLLVLVSCGSRGKDGAQNNANPTPATPMPATGLSDTQASSGGVPAPAVAEAVADKGDEPVSHFQFAGPEGKTGAYGAIAAGAEGDYFGGYGVYGFPNRAGAERAAIEGCQRDAAESGHAEIAAKCDSAVYFYNACGAVANGQNGAWGTGWSTNSWSEACRFATESCLDFKGVNCEAYMYVCSPGGLRGTCDGTFQIDGDTTRLSPGN